MNGVVWGFLERQKLQQLTSHGFFMSLEEKLAFQHPHLRRGQRGGRRGGQMRDEGRGGGGAGGERRMGEEEEPCPAAAFINMRTCSL